MWAHRASGLELSGLFNPHLSLQSAGTQSLHHHARCLCGVVTVLWNCLGFVLCLFC